MYKTLTQITQGVIGKIGLVTGTAVQTYTEPQINNAVQDAFYMIFRKRFWEHLSDWYTYQLDGVTGVVTTDLSAIVKRYTDIKEIYAGEDTQGPRIVKPAGREHLLRTAGDTPLYYTPIKYSAGATPFKTRVLQFWPKTATGPVTFFARTCPDPFTSSQEIPFEADMMEWAAAWMTLEVDGLNPGNAAKCKSMFEVAYNDIVSAGNDDVVGHGAGPYRDWRTVI